MSNEETKEEIASPSEIAIRVIAEWSSKNYKSVVQETVALQLLIVSVLEEIMGADQ